jgi:4-carboxymuconolactone decarboxylase
MTTVTEMLRYTLCGALLALYAVVSAQADDGSVSRLPRISDQPGDPVLKEMFDDIRQRGGAISNFELTQGHAPRLAKARNALAMALRLDTVLPPLLREIAIMRTAQIAESEYARNRHMAMAKTCGMTDAQLEGLAAWSENELFDRTTRAMLAYVEALVLQGGVVDNETFGELEKHFKPQEIVELTVIVGHTFAASMFNKALKVRAESDGRGTVRGPC